jgi:radical SAM superfamily enzyme
MEFSMFEQGVIRPPSEASSLLVRATRNCPWNRCLFCPAYKGTTFSRRSVDEIKSDIDEMARHYGINGQKLTSAFLQDADSLILPTHELLEIIKHIKHKFPSIKRITSYARAKSLKKRSVDSFMSLKKAGLTRIHTGLESGSSEVLKLIKKGEKPEDMIEGGKRVMAAGISLSEYIMPGIGGKALSHEHAIETARVLNHIRPDYIRVRTFALPPNSPMETMVDQGLFQPLKDNEVVLEIRWLLEHLNEMPSHFRCGDFSLNLLMHVDGYLDKDKEHLLAELDSFLSLSEEDQKAYSLLQRSGYYNVDPSHMIQNEDLMTQLREKLKELETGHAGSYHQYIRALMACQLPQPQTDQWQ